MNTERTITICGKSVDLRYCAATETGFETISGKNAGIFWPEFEKNEAGETEMKPPLATSEDYIKLGIAAIIAAYKRRGEAEPVTANEIIYDAQPEEVISLMRTVEELREEWYKIPSIIQTDEPKADDEPKNA